MIVLTRESRLLPGFISTQGFALGAFFYVHRQQLGAAVFEPQGHPCFLIRYRTMDSNAPYWIIVHR